MRLKLHPAKADAKTEWEKLEKEWAHLRGKLEVIGREVKDGYEGYRRHKRPKLSEGASSDVAVRTHSTKGVQEIQSPGVAAK